MKDFKYYHNMNSLLPFHFGISLLINKQIKPNIIIDIGTQKSFYLTFYQTISEKVFGFEPNIDSYYSIYSDVKHEPDIALYNEAVGTTVGTVEFYACKPDRSFSVADRGAVDVLLNKGWFKEEDFETRFVQQTTLDERFQSEPAKIDLIKADTEWDDLNVIRGGLSVINEHRPLLQLEHVKQNKEKNAELESLLGMIKYVEVTPYFETDQKYFVPKEWL